MRGRHSARKETLLQVVSHIASGSKHFKAEAPHHDSVSHVDHVGGPFDSWRPSSGRGSWRFVRHAQERCGQCARRAHWCGGTRFESAGLLEHVRAVRGIHGTTTTLGCRSRRDLSERIAAARMGKERAQDGVAAMGTSFPQYAFVDGHYVRTRYADTMRRFFDSAPTIDYLALRRGLNADKLFFYDSLDDTPRAGETEEAAKERIHATEAELRQVWTTAGLPRPPGVGRREGTAEARTEASRCSACRGGAHTWFPKELREGHTPHRRSLISSRSLTAWCHLVPSWRSAMRAVMPQRNSWRLRTSDGN